MCAENTAQNNCPMSYVLSAFTDYRLPITDSLSRWIYQSSCYAGFVRCGDGSV